MVGGPPEPAIRPAMVRRWRTSEASIDTGIDWVPPFDPCGSC
jgi:hypothetical protein